jgi:hypothetical protein
VYCVVRPRFGPPKDAGTERKQFMRRLNREWDFQRAEACRAPTGPSSSPAAKKAKRERSAPRSPGGQLVAAVGSTAYRAKAAMNSVISSMVARATKSWRPGGAGADAEAEHQARLPIRGEITLSIACCLDNFAAFSI